jgi:hypothetical protein
MGGACSTNGGEEVRVYVIGRKVTSCGPNMFGV